MDISTAVDARMHLVEVICSSKMLIDKYLRPMSKYDAVKVTDLHLKHHKVPGLLDSLDCTHFYWKNFPMAWQGQFTVKEGSPTIIMEAVADYNLLIWYPTIGRAGSLNNINIWDTSPLHDHLLSGFFEQNDFDFIIDDKSFKKI